MQLSWRRLVPLLSLAALGLIWFLLGPRQLGGSTTLAVVAGSSMSPALEPGEVVLVREGGDYAVGDIVGYRDPTLGDALVVHRIARAEESRFVTRGDANGFEDRYEPAPSEIVGRLWTTVPGLGGGVAWLFEGSSLAIVVGGMAGIAMMGFLRVRRPGNDRSSQGPPADLLLAPFGQSALLLGLAGMVVFGVITLGAMLTSTSRAAPAPASYTQSSTITYTSGPDVAGLYDGDRAATGDPIFLAAAEYLDVKAAYALSSEETIEANGVARLEAIVADDEGWQRTITLISGARIGARGSEVSGRLELADVQELIAQREEITGVALREYRVTLAASFETTGAIAELPFEGEIGSGITFTLREERLFVADRRLSRDEVGRIVIGGQLEREFQVANAISVLGIEWETREARRVGAVGLLASIAFTLVLGMFMTSSLRRGEAARIQARYGPLLVPVDDAGIALGVRMIDMGNMRALATLATRYQEPILHLVRGRTHEYVIYRGERGYRYTTTERPRGRQLDLPWGRSAKQQDTSGRQP